MVELSAFLQDLSSEQKAACLEQGNVLLTACPGSGKTRTLTHRLAYIASNCGESHKLNIAITYTNRAADEITNRLDTMGLDLKNVWTGTIHQFCMKFIIRPYAMYSKRLCKGYSIIDKYTKDKYCDEIAKQQEVKLRYGEDPFKYETVVEAYEELLENNKEIDFDMILRFSEELLSKYFFISENISPLINSILVDEFQDTNELQYRILAKIFNGNKLINLMFVGDVNQAIYGSLGGVAKNKAEIEDLYKTTFKEMSLTGCYRSTSEIVAFYSLFEVSKTGVYSVAKIKDYPSIIDYDSDISKKALGEELANLIKKELKLGVKPEEICIAAPKWELLFPLSKKLKSLLPTISFDAPDISPIRADPLNPLYLIARLLFMAAGEKVTLRKRIANELLSIMREDYKISFSNKIINYDILHAVNCCRTANENGIECLREAIAKVFKLLKVDSAKETAIACLCKQFFNQIYNRVSHHNLPTDYNSIANYFKERKGIVVSTIHGIKGEEYTTVIATGLLKGYVPHWNCIIDKEVEYTKSETLKLLYVLCSRAKKNLHLFSETGHFTRNNNALIPTYELSNTYEDYIANKGASI